MPRSSPDGSPTRSARPMRCWRSRHRSERARPRSSTEHGRSSSWAGSTRRRRRSPGWRTRRRRTTSGPWRRSASRPSWSYGAAVPTRAIALAERAVAYRSPVPGGDVRVRVTRRWAEWEAGVPAAGVLGPIAIRSLMGAVPEVPRDRSARARRRERGRHGHGPTVGGEARSPGRWRRTRLAGRGRGCVLGGRGPVGRLRGVPAGDVPLGPG